MSVHPRVVFQRRATITALPLYYSGYLLKKQSKEKDFKKYYAELRGTILFLYKDDTQDTYTEKLDLEQLKFMTLNSPYRKKMPTIFTLKLDTKKVELKMDNADTGEVWRGYILTVAKKEIPSKLQLLPGQMLLLEDVLAEEKKRNPPARPPLPPRPSFLRQGSPTPAPAPDPAPAPATAPAPAPTPARARARAPSPTPTPTPTRAPSPPPSEDNPDNSNSEMPSCFFNVTRKEAEQMLETNPEYGGIILRPSTRANNYALTLRQLTPSGPVMKNYRLTPTSSGFVIELDTPVTVSSLNDVLKYFLEKTEYRLHPYKVSEAYDTHIEVSPAPKSASNNSSSAKAVPKAQIAPMIRPQIKEEVQPPPTKQEEDEYVVPDEEIPDYLNLKLAEVDNELREVLQIRRQNLYDETSKDKNTMNEKQTTGICPPAVWAN